MQPPEAPPSHPSTAPGPDLSLQPAALPRQGPGQPGAGAAAGPGAAGAAPPGGRRGARLG